jgi:hypothetical protein
MSVCDRGFVLVGDEGSADDLAFKRERLPARFREIQLNSDDAWERILEAVSGKA